MMTYIKISTTLDRETHKQIKEKGYKYADLIKIGLRAKEIQEGYESFLLNIAERFENIAKIQEQTARVLNEQMGKMIDIKSDFEKLVKRQEILIESLNQAINRFDRLLEKQEEMVNKMTDRFDRLIDKIENLIEDRTYDLERKLERLSKSLNLSIRIIENSYPKDRATAIVEAILKGDDEAINKILKEWKEGST